MAWDESETTQNTPYFKRILNDLGYLEHHR